MSVKKFAAAAVLTSGVLITGEAMACGALPANKDMEVKLSMVPHADVLTPDVLKVFYNGITITMTAEGNAQEDTGMRVRCMVPTSLEFSLNKEIFEAAIVNDDTINLSYDLNYDAKPEDLRGCITLPVIDMERTEGDTPDLTKLFFTMNETSAQTKARQELEVITDPSNKANEAWCYTVRLEPGL